LLALGCVKQFAELGRLMGLTAAQSALIGKAAGAKGWPSR
jgi:hypothetical protein